MNSKLYRCGWCGHPTDKEGKRLRDDAFKKADRLIKTYDTKSHTEHLNGECCPQGSATSEEQYVQVTRSMAIDAGDRRLEGQWIKW